MTHYKTFKRTWWKRNKNWPDGRAPCIGKKKYFSNTFIDQDAARDFCMAWNATHDAGFLSLKAEYEGETT